MPSSSRSCSSSLSEISSAPSSLQQECSPYLPGRTLTLKRHTPPCPLGRKYGDSGVFVQDVPKDVSQLDWCLLHPPRPGETDETDVRDIKFTTSIRTGNCCGAQVLLTEQGLVAKLYDPLHYAFFDEDSPDEKINITTAADQDYTIEAHAYSSLLNTDLQGTIMPVYHGSWTTDICTSVDGQESVREVRLILMEHIDGKVMMDVDPEDLTHEERENVMCKVIEASTDLQLAGLEHTDFEPRNIMLEASTRHLQEIFESKQGKFPYGDPELRVCVIDYGRSFVHGSATREKLRSGSRNPLFFWAGRDIYCRYGWLPPRKIATDWMWKVWANGGQDDKYIKVERDPDDFLGRPVYLEN